MSFVSQMKEKEHDIFWGTINTLHRNKKFSSISRFKYLYYKFQPKNIIISIKKYVLNLFKILIDHLQF